MPIFTTANYPPCYAVAMRLTAMLATILLMLPACTEKPEPVAVPVLPVVHYSKQAASPWFDLSKRLHSRVCLVTPNGMDIRQSAYLALAGNEATQVVTRVRDYVEREKGQPDEQWLVKFLPASGKGTKLAIPQGVFPERFVVSSDHTRICLGGLTQAEDSSWSGHATLSVWDSDAEPQVIPLSGPVVVQRFTSDGTLVCLEIPAAGLSAGLLAPAIDWRSPLQEVVPKGHSPGFTPPAWQLAPGAKCRAKQRIVFDPAQPAKAVVQIELTTGSEPPETFEHIYPYHVTYAPFQWEPAGAWADGSTWIVKEFLPNPTGKQSRANHRGVFRLVAYGTTEMQRTLIADHVEASLGFVAGNGLVFYTLRRPGKDDDSWEVWVASSTSLDQRLVWRTTDAQYVSVSDYLSEGRLLVERQYFAQEDGRPQLHSELREISLHTLERNNTAVAPTDVLDPIIDGIEAPPAIKAPGNPTLGIPPKS